MTSNRTWNGDVDSVLAVVNNHRGLVAPPEGEPGDKLRTQFEDEAGRDLTTDTEEILQDSHFGDGTCHRVQTNEHAQAPESGDQQSPAIRSRPELVMVSQDTWLPLCRVSQSPENGICDIRHGYLTTGNT
jgi:hypothetical protein